jgi:hypothetical protein
MIAETSFKFSPIVNSDGDILLTKKQVEKISKGIHKEMKPHLQKHAQLFNELVESRLELAESESRLAKSESRLAKSESRLAKSESRLAESRLELAQSKQKELELAQTLTELNKTGAEIDQRIEERSKKIEERSKKIEERSKKIEERSKKIEEQTKTRQALVARQFYGIFSREAKSLTPEEISQIFKDYLTDGSLSFEHPAEGQSYPQMNSMKAVTKFLADHPEFKTCNFRVFQDKVFDITTLTEFLKKSEIKAIGMSNNISQQAKDSLANAVAARNGGLKVQYFA